MRLAGYGWRVLSVDYAPGVKAPASIRAWYDFARQRWPGPICAFGRSAGAHLALLVARERPLACVIGHGAITDLRTLGGSPEADELVRDFVIPSFGSRLGEYSPVTYARDLQVSTLLATGAGDRLASCAAQLEPFAQQNPRVRSACLPTGTAPFIHGDVDAAALAVHHRREQAVLRQASVLATPRRGRFTLALGSRCVLRFTPPPTVPSSRQWTVRATGSGGVVVEDAGSGSTPVAWSVGRGSHCAALTVTLSVIDRTTSGQRTLRLVRGQARTVRL